MKKFKKIATLALIACLLIPTIGAAVSSAAEKDSLYEQFETPAAKNKTAPLWFWNREVEDMTTDQVREIVRKSYLESGYNGFGILPQWQTDYFSEEYFELYEAALDEGSKYGMEFSLYDENGFPSYNAGGLLEEQYPDLLTKRLDLVEKDAKDGAEVSLRLPEGKLMGAVAMNMDTFERVDISDEAVIIPPKEYDPADEPIGVSASTTYSVSPGYSAEMAVDGNMTTRWNSESYSGGNQYLQIKFNSKVTFDGVKVYEDTNPILHRTNTYYIRYYDYTLKKWVDVANGKKITDAGVSHTFDPVNSDLVRLFLKDLSGDSASINEFQIFNGTTQLSVPPVQPKEEPGYFSSSDYNADYNAEKAFDGNRGTRWNSANGTRAPHEIGVNFGSQKTVNKVIIYEHLGRIDEFEVQYWSNGEWRTCATDNTIGEIGKTLTFAPVTSSRMRIYIKSILGTPTDLPTIWEIEFYNGDQKLVPDNPGDIPWDGSYLDYTVPAGNWKVMAFMCVVDGNNGMDYLDPASVRAFIDITYEEYYKRFKKYFDNGTITSAFYDEPAFWPAGGRTPYGAQGARFWTPSLNEEYAKYYSDKNPVLDYPALFHNIGTATDEARNRLQNVRTEMFANNYIGQVNTWCEDHGIELTGHMLFEGWTNPVGVHGDLMKVFKNQAIPGVDVIDYFGMTQEAYKVISSSAYNWDKGRVMSESFGVFQRTDSTDIFKSTMDQYAKGINLIVPHAVWYDNDPARVTYVPELSYRNPQFSADLPVLNDYIGRLNVMLQNGRHVADIAMLYPIDYLESVFLFNGNENNPGDADYLNVSETLSLTARRDFTYLHPDVLDDRCSIEDNIIKLNNDTNYEEYKVFIMPSMKVIDLNNLKKIKAFYDNGGKVISTTQLPFKGTNASDNAEVISIITEMFGVNPTTADADVQNSNAKGGKAYFIKTGYQTKLAGILDQAVPVYDVKFGNVASISGGNLSYIHKVKEDRNIYFVANSSNTNVSTTFTVRGELNDPYFWNPMTGEKTIAIGTSSVVDGETVTTFNISLSAVSSLLLVESSEFIPPEGLKINAELVEEEDKTIARIAASDDSEEGINVLLIAAVYDESGKLVSISTEKQLIKGTKSIDLPLQDYDDKYSVKIFSWDDTNIYPLVESISL